MVTTIFSPQNIKAQDIAQKNYTILKNDSNEYVELYDDGGIITYYYQDYNNGLVIVITSSIEAGTDCFFNYQNTEAEHLLNNVKKEYIKDSIVFNNIISIVKDNVLNKELKKNENINVIFEQDDFNIIPYGLFDVKTYWYNKYGSDYYDKLIVSKKIDSYQCGVYEVLQTNIIEYNRFMGIAGDTLSLLLSFLTMPKSVSIALGILTLIKDGVEYIKYNYTVLQYDIVQYYTRDADINYRTMYQEGKRNLYYLYELDNKKEISYRFGDNDLNYYNTDSLIELGIQIYKQF